MIHPISGERGHVASVCGHTPRSVARLSAGLHCAPGLIVAFFVSWAPCLWLWRGQAPDLWLICRPLDPMMVLPLWLVTIYPHDGTSPGPRVG